MYVFARTAVTTGWQQKFCLRVVEAGNPRDQDVGKIACFWGLRERTRSMPLTRFWWFASSLWIAEASPDLYPHLHVAFSLCGVCVQISPFCMDIGHIGLSVYPTSGMISSQPNWLHLQASCFQIRSRSEVPGVRTSIVRIWVGALITGVLLNHCSSAEGLRPFNIHVYVGFYLISYKWRFFPPYFWMLQTEYLYFPKSICWEVIPSVMLFGGEALGRWLGHEGDSWKPSWMGFSAHIEKIPERSLTYVWGHTEKKWSLN